MDNEDFKGGKRHHTSYYQGRRHIIFKGRMMRSMRVYQWMDSFAVHREVFYRTWSEYEYLLPPR